MRALVLFSGTGSVEKGLRSKFGANGVDIVSVDNDPKWNSTHRMDARAFYTKRMYPPGYFDIIWASPPCTEYSYAKTVGVRKIRESNALVRATFRYLAYMRPKYWFVENPVNLLRHQPFMKAFERFRNVCTYCKYGAEYKKPTCIWSNCKLNLMVCDRDTPCAYFKRYGKHRVTCQHGPTPNGTQGMGNGHNVYPVPLRLTTSLFSQLRV